MDVINLDNSGLGAVGIGFLTVEDNYSDLVAAYPVAPLGAIAYATESEGTKWLPGSLGGTYYSKGGYVFDGVNWVSDTSAVSEALALLIDEAGVTSERAQVTIDSGQIFITTSAGVLLTNDAATTLYPQPVGKGNYDAANNWYDFSALNPTRLWLRIGGNSLTNGNFGFFIRGYSDRNDLPGSIEFTTFGPLHPGRGGALDTSVAETLMYFINNPTENIDVVQVFAYSQANETFQLDFFDLHYTETLG